MPSASIARSAVRLLSQQPSTPVLDQLPAGRQMDPAESRGSPVAMNPSLIGIGAIPLSLPLKAPANPVPFAPLPLLSVRFPKPICQKTAEMFDTSPLGAT